MLTNTSILLIIGGGIAAYKSLDLIRRLRERGAAVRAVLTPAGAQFITPLSVASLTEQPCYTDLFSLKDEVEMGHIRLSREADLIIAAPATADLIAKLANGLANDLASTTLLAADKPILLAPAMNWRMWENPATQRNLATLALDGRHFVGPGSGAMACGETGPGRMAEPLEIVEAAERLLAPKAQPLKGRHVLVTAGPTHEPIDPVRYIANRSSGKQGFAIAAQLAALGAQVSLIAGPVQEPTPAGVVRIDVESAVDMLAACQQALPADAAVCVAAVADWRVEASPDKIKKRTGAACPDLKLVENPDILATLAGMAQGRPKLVVGFAAETNDVEANAIAKRAKKACDWIVANDVSAGTGVMGGNRNQVLLITADGAERWPDLPKADVAARLAQKIAAALGA
jgi:phosphopantothenoylcysteine decarboxylase / phosphopantothenate---cysteine ligase